MFRKIRRKEKQLTAEECNEILTMGEYGTLILNVIFVKPHR
jgi:hypothetical protein